MERLFDKKNQLIKMTSLDIVRETMHRILWDAPLVCIRGPRGVGKTNDLDVAIYQTALQTDEY